jgi:hypothetical protein
VLSFVLSQAAKTNAHTITATSIKATISFLFFIYYLRCFFYFEDADKPSLTTLFFVPFQQRFVTKLHIRYNFFADIRRFASEF